MSVISLGRIEGCMAHMSYMKEEGVGVALKGGNAGE